MVQKEAAFARFWSVLRDASPPVTLLRTRVVGNSNLVALVRSGKAGDELRQGRDQMVSRRGFNAAHTSGSAGAVAPLSFTLERNAWVPNNPRLPALLYKGVVGLVGDDPASLFEAIFRRNGWPPQ
jgi:hypothetical protein